MVAVFYMDAPHLHVELLQQHRTNMLSFQVAPGGRCWFIVGCYLSPDDKFTTGRVFAVISQRSCRAALVVARDFNTDLAAPEGSNYGE